ncbi:helix-turn-helix domain-containing protein [Anaerovibrio sp.]|uniref:helix-turn-helix domain-containing protein n=1 Tax=Anaerovibrio sp. TaxID=1872532 RepID=UPI003F16053B
MSLFSELIKEKRLHLKLSLRAAAKIIGISYTYLAILEKGIDKRTGIINKPTPETLQMIASAYHLDYNYLLSLWGYIESVKLELPAHLQELIEECKHFSEDDVNTLIQYAKFISWQRKKQIEFNQKPD